MMEKSLGRGQVYGRKSLRARKTLKRLDHTNPSVGIDRMNDYQATYNKNRWLGIAK
jgi:hypothetical protein